MIHRRRKSVFFLNGVPDRIDQLVGELDHLIAVRADQMVMPAVVEQLVVAHAAAEIGFRYHTEIAKEF